MLCALGIICITIVRFNEEQIGEWLKIIIVAIINDWVLIQPLKAILIFCCCRNIHKREDVVDLPNILFNTNI